MTVVHSVEALQMRKLILLVGVVGLVACGQVLSSPAKTAPRPTPFHPLGNWGLFLLGGQSFEVPWLLSSMFTVTAS